MDDEGVDNEGMDDQSTDAVIHAEMDEANFMPSEANKSR